jgi:hypothetical protein
VWAQDACVASHEQAQRARSERRLVEARKQLVSCERADCPRALRSDCSNWLVDVDTRLPTLVFAIVGPQGDDLVDVRVYANGVLLSERSDGRAIAVDPGDTKFRFEAPGHEPLEQLIAVREAEKNRLVHAKLRSSPPLSAAHGGSADSLRVERSAASPSPAADVARSSRLMTVASALLAGVSLGATVSAVAVGVAGKRKYESLEQSCAPTCSRVETRPGRRMYLAADVNAGVAVASAAAALWIYVARGRAAARTRIETSATASSAFLGITRHF